MINYAGYVLFAITIIALFMCMYVFWVWCINWEWIKANTSWCRICKYRWIKFIRWLGEV